MKKSESPYTEIITDEYSGIKVLSVAYKIWIEGYEAGRNDERASNRKLMGGMN